MASIQRTFDIDNIGPSELACLFADYDALEQSQFFTALSREVAEWGGLGWCGQSCEIARLLDDDGRKVIAKLAEHALAEPPVPA